MYRIRLVTKDLTQREGIDYSEVFSNVVKHTSIRLLLFFIAQNNLELDQLDVKTTFLHDYLDETIYMVQPKGFEIQGKKDLCCLLKRSIYGLK